MGCPGAAGRRGPTTEERAGVGVGVRNPRAGRSRHAGAGKEQARGGGDGEHG